MRLAPFALVLVFGASVSRAQNPRVTRTKRGDTTVVSIAGTGVWGPAREPVVVKRISGESNETTFGQVYIATAMPDGGAVLFDGKSLDGPIIRQFNADGKFVRNIGRPGSGPGEYEAGRGGGPNMTSRADGSVIVRDGARAVMRFGPDGVYREGFMLYHTNGSTNEIVAANDGTYWVRAAFAQIRPSSSAPQPLRPMVHYDASGKKLDSLVHGAGWVPPTADPVLAREWWAPIPDGRVLFTRTDKVGFLLVDPKRSTPPLVVELAATPTPYTAAERAEREAYENFRTEMGTSVGEPYTRRPVPAMKPVAIGGLVDVDGRIWVTRPGPGQKVKERVTASYGGRGGSGQFKSVWQDQTIYVGFRPDGTLLGELRFPAGVYPSFVGNVAWAMVPDEDDVPVLVKYRIANE